jgi:hypothetical protein
MIARCSSLRLSMIGALFSLAAACAANAADPKPQPEESPCQKLTGADRTECEQRLREQQRERAAAPQPEPEQGEPAPDVKSEGNDDSDTADPPQP